MNCMPVVENPEPRLIAVVELAELTAKESPAVCVKGPVVAVIFKGYVPTAAVPTDTVSVEEPEFVIDGGLNEADAPAGKPLTLRLTFPANPLPPVTVTEYGALPPCAAEASVGETPRVKSVTVIVREGGCMSVSP